MIATKVEPESEPQAHGFNLAVLRVPPLCALRCCIPSLRCPLWRGLGSSYSWGS